MTEDMVAGCKLCTDKQEPHVWHEHANWISHACQFPADQQANLEDAGGNWSAGMRRQHPWEGKRPDWSGWCVVTACNCTCHEGDDIEISEFQLEGEMLCPSTAANDAPSCRSF